MPRTISIGQQSFCELRQNNYFYIDKTQFIKEWWLGGDSVTLITRPRRFGKTLMLDTVRTFFAPEFVAQAKLYEGLEIDQDEKIKCLQNTIPVIFISFASIKENNLTDTIKVFKFLIERCYAQFSFLLKQNDLLSETERHYFLAVNRDMPDFYAKTALLSLSEYLFRFYGKKAIILLDEYDAPLHEAYIHGYWPELVDFMRGFFTSTFKTNYYLARGLITGITRISNESIFSDMNNLEVASITSDLYADCFGFTEAEVFNSLDEYGLTNKEEVKQWYDGFIFGRHKEIYNPWSIICYLKHKKLSAYWASTSSNALVGELLAHGDALIKEETGRLLKNQSITTKFDEQIAFSQLDTATGAIWSLLMASGYVKPLAFDSQTQVYEISVTNYESLLIFEKLISDWFSQTRISKNKFINALFADNLDEMNNLMNEIAKTVFSYFDTAHKEENPESFYHAFVLGLIVDLKQYEVTSNSESGYGRHDVLLLPKNRNDHAIVLEFKLYNEKKEKSLTDTCHHALRQICKNEYISKIKASGLPLEKIYIYGFAFKDYKVKILGGQYNTVDLKDE